MSASDDQQVRGRSAPGVATARRGSGDPYRDVATGHPRTEPFGPATVIKPPPRSMRGVVRRFGWRAYALPVLALVTVIALVTAGGRSTSAPRGDTPAGPPAHAAQPAPPTASHSIALKSDVPAAGSRERAIAADALPAGAAYTKQGDGTFRVLSGTGPVAGHGTVHRYSVDAENGLADVDLGQYATFVQNTLSNKLGWAGHRGVALQRVDSGSIDFHITLVSSLTVRAVCGYQIHIETSCYVRAGGAPGVDTNRVIINDSRWVRGSSAYIGDIDAYRIYLINHETGHALGHRHAHQCLPGGLAPLMMEQTIGLVSAATGKLCEANPWPYPPGVKGAPGAEQRDTAKNSEFGLHADEGGG